MCSADYNVISFERPRDVYYSNWNLEVLMRFHVLMKLEHPTWNPWIGSIAGVIRTLDWCGPFPHPHVGRNNTSLLS